jgi:hypothetical protein
MFESPFLIPILTAVGAGGAAWGAVQVTQASTRARVDEIEDELAKAAQAERGVKERLVRLETKIDLLLAGQLRLNDIQFVHEHEHEHHEHHHDVRKEPK